MRLAIVLATAMVAVAGAVLADCAPDRVDVRQGGNSLRFTVEIADTPDERALGLMFRKEMPQFSGMLFIYERPQTVAFWMKNTLIPLDIIFLDERGVVQSIAANTTPLSTESLFGGDDILAVLEINAGLAARLGITPGAELRHPDLDQSIAAWSCDGD